MVERVDEAEEDKIADENAQIMLLGAQASADASGTENRIGAVPFGLGLLVGIAVGGLVWFATNTDVSIPRPQVPPEYFSFALTALYGSMFPFIFGIACIILLAVMRLRLRAHGKQLTPLQNFETGVLIGPIVVVSFMALRGLWWSWA